MGRGGRRWSEEEVAATVEAYFDMWRLDRQDTPFSKKEHRRRLMTRLDERTDASVEYKFQNISAVLEQMGVSQSRPVPQLHHIGDMLRAL